MLQLIEEGQSYSDKYKFSEPPLVTAPSVKSKSPKGSKPSEAQINNGHSTSVKSEPVQSKDAASIPNQSSVSDGQASIPLTGNQMSTMDGSTMDGSTMDASTMDASSDAVKKFKPIEKKARMSRTVIPQPITATVLIDAPTPKSQPIQSPIVQDEQCSTVSNLPDLNQDLKSQTVKIQTLLPDLNQDLKSQTVKIQTLREQATYKSQMGTVSPQFDSSHFAPTVSNMVPKQTAQHQHQQPMVSLATVSSIPTATLVTNPVQVMSGQPRIVPVPTTKTQIPPKPLVPSSPATVSPNPPPSPGKSKSKRRGCRCGLATPTPGKLTCCGQRCPCYVDGKGCYDCKCRGCRNPHHANTTPGIMVTPAVKPAPVPTTTATIKTILAGKSVPVTKSFGGGSVQTSVPIPVMRPITTIGSCQLVPIPSPGTGNGQMMVTQKAPNPNSSLLLSSIVSNPSLTLTSADPTPSTFSFFPMSFKATSSHSAFHSSASNQPMMIPTHPIMTSQPMPSQSSINQTNQTVDQTSSFNEPLTLPLTMDDLTIGSNDDDPTKMAESNFMIDDHISMM